LAGSKANRETMLNRKHPLAFQIGRLGDAMLKNVKPSAYDIAKSGGRHAGFLKDQAAKSDGELTRSIRSLRSQVETHCDKIANPSNWVTPGITPQHLNGLVNSYWPKEIANFTQQIEILERILAERKQ
jgi:hypothetical protein